LINDADFFVVDDRNGSGVLVGSADSYVVEFACVPKGLGYGSYMSRDMVQMRS
jgi:hypothetical protein